MGMLKVFAGLAFLFGGGSFAGMIYYGDEKMFIKFWDDALLIICGGVLLLVLDKLILTLEEIRNYLKKFSDIMEDK
tara:strand:- start:315 stop:542 length:228 start_codon:yes stop_codon:yes gene_type:complete